MGAERRAKKCSYTYERWSSTTRLDQVISSSPGYTLLDCMHLSFHDARIRSSRQMLQLKHLTDTCKAISLTHLATFSCKVDLIVVLGQLYNCRETPTRIENRMHKTVCWHWNRLGRLRFTLLSLARWAWL